VVNLKLGVGTVLNIYNDILTKDSEKLSAIKWLLDTIGWEFVFYRVGLRVVGL